MNVQDMTSQVTPQFIAFAVFVVAGLGTILTFHGIYLSFKRRDDFSALNSRIRVFLFILSFVVMVGAGLTLGML